MPLSHNKESVNDLQLRSRYAKFVYCKCVSLQCRRILGARVHIFLLGFHLRFGNCGGLGRGNICRGSRC